MFKLTNKVAVITGATGGIGREIVKDMVSQGASVALVDIAPAQDKLTEFAKSLELQGNAKVETYSLDFLNSDEIKALPKQIEKDMGSLDILVNCAGLTRDSLAMRMKEDDWDIVIDINLTSLFRLSQAVIRGMMKRRFGRIINIASIVGFTGNAGQANYTASKGGVVALTKTMGQELGSRGITVNAVAPGFIKTPMTDVLTQEVQDKMISQVPMGRMGNPDEIAKACVFLASDEASYITGNTIHVNGGMAMY